MLGAPRVLGLSVRGHRRSRAAGKAGPAGNTNPPALAQAETPPAGPPAPDAWPQAPDAGPVRSGGSIRRRMSGILALPMVAILLLLAVVAITETQDYRASTDTTRAVSLALGVQDLVQELQTERGLTAGLLGGNVGFRAELRPAREQVDQQRTVVQRLADNAGEVGERVRAVLARLSGLTAIRASTDAGSGDRAGTFRYFTERIVALNHVDYGLDRSSDRALRRGVAAFEALADIKESTAQERAFLNGVFSAGGFATGEFVQFAAMRAEKQEALDRFTRNATVGQRQANAYVLDTGAARTAAYFARVAVDAADGRPMVVNPQSWWSALTTVLDGLRDMQEYVGSEIQARAQTLQNEATQRIGGLLGVVLLCFVGALVLLVVASRSITRPLAALAAEAGNVASHRLPEAVRHAQSGDDDRPLPPPEPVRVPARASSEIRSVADALDRVQAVAHALATEQAVMRRRTTESLANLGRRNQNLLRRQLGFITNLEREETDPSGLANLFELDHLATRMRRNAESLLVLVGEATPRQWAAPLPIADVIRAAIAEVEEYRRVSLRRIDDGLVSGAVVSGLSHMIAELVENGLAFSPPDVDVEIQGRLLGDQYLIAVIDQGVGMDPENLAKANARLRGDTDFVAAPTRYLGHHVVGHLARQLGIDVALTPSPVTGISARVLIPPALLVDPGGQPAGNQTAGSRAAVSQTAVSQTAGIRATGATADHEAARPLPATETSGLRFPVSTPIGPPALAIKAQPEVVVEYVTLSDVDDSGAEKAPSAGAPGQSGDDVPRTRNGLRKRVPRVRAAEPTAAHSPEDMPVDHSPAEVRSRLMALRAGVQRGESELLASGQAAAPRGTTEPERGQHDRRDTH